MGMEPETPPFLFVTCHVGAGDALKAELARRWPELRLAFSRPGFLTFKIPAGHPLGSRLDLGSVFARTTGYAMGSVQGTTVSENAVRAWETARLAERGGRFAALHVWERDRIPVGEKGFEPGPTPASVAAAESLLAEAPEDLFFHQGPEAWLASRGQSVLDCILVEPDLWWLGTHRVVDPLGGWPGGSVPLSLPPQAASRAYLKMAEALAWSRLPVRPDEVCVELGAAPGGASQALLDRGLVVMGVDPAEIDPVVLAHPNFQHLQARGADLRRRTFAPARWIMADMNVAPQYTLDTVEAIVTHRQVHARGLLLTLKLSTWELAQEIPAWCNRVRNWGFREVRVRQLAHNRQEICLAALKHRTLRRLGR